MPYVHPSFNGPIFDTGWVKLKYSLMYCGFDCYSAHPNGDIINNMKYQALIRRINDQVYITGNATVLQDTPLLNYSKPHMCELSFFFYDESGNFIWTGDLFRPGPKGHTVVSTQQGSYCNIWTMEIICDRDLNSDYDALHLVCDRYRSFTDIGSDQEYTTLPKGVWLNLTASYLTDYDFPWKFAYNQGGNEFAKRGLVISPYA